MNELAQIDPSLGGRPVAGVACHKQQPQSAEGHPSLAAGTFGKTEVHRRPSPPESGRRQPRAIRPDGGLLHPRRPAITSTSAA